jgi:hypothetical protein
MSTQARIHVRPALLMVCLAASFARADPPGWGVFVLWDRMPFDADPTSLRDPVLPGYSVHADGDIPALAQPFYLNGEGRPACVDLATTPPTVSFDRDDCKGPIAKRDDAGDHDRVFGGRFWNGGFTCGSGRSGVGCVACYRSPGEDGDTLYLSDLQNFAANGEPLGPNLHHGTIVTAGNYHDDFIFSSKVGPGDPKNGARWRNTGWDNTGTSTTSVSCNDGDFSQYLVSYNFGSASSPRWSLAYLKTDAHGHLTAAAQAKLTNDAAQVQDDASLPACADKAHPAACTLLQGWALVVSYGFFD